MPEESLIASPGPQPGTVRTERGEVLTVPAGWELLPPGDATLTRRVKAAGPSWTVQERRGRKLFSRGVWAPADAIVAARAALEAERGTEAHARKQQAGRARRERQQAAYVDDFARAIEHYLAFDPAYDDLARRLAQAVTRHATPVGSGTVARTQRLPVERRAELAVLAWLRHHTTDYDRMTIPRVRGKRREVRRTLARQSCGLLERYRRGQPADASCPLRRALEGLEGSTATAG